MKLGELAARLTLELRGDPAVEIVGPAPVETAGPGTITFLARDKYLPLLKQSNASCVIISAELAPAAQRAALISTNPYADFARTLAIFFPPYQPPMGIDASVRIGADVRIGDGASIGPFCVVGDGVAIGRNAVIHPNVTIYPGVRIGDDFVCHSQVSLRENVIVGDRVLIHNGASIGADGFAFVEHNGGLVKIPQIGAVVIEDDVEIGANTTIDRAMFGATVIRRGVKLDDLIHIAHNCDVGEFSRFAAQVGLAGSVRVGEWCEFGGQAGCADHIAIGDHVRVVAQAGIPNDVSANSAVAGTPAINVRAFRRMAAAWPRLPEIMKRLRTLEERAAKSAELPEKVR